MPLPESLPCARGGAAQRRRGWKPCLATRYRATPPGPQPLSRPDGRQLPLHRGANLDSRRQRFLGNGIKSIPCSPGPSPVNRPSSGGRISGSGAAAPAGVHRIGTVALFRFLFGDKKERIPARCRFPGSRAAKVQPLSRPDGRQLPCAREAKFQIRFYPSQKGEYQWKKMSL